MQNIGSNERDGERFHEGLQQRMHEFCIEEQLRQHIDEGYREWNIPDNDSSIPLKYVFTRDAQLWGTPPEAPDLDKFYSRKDLSTNIYISNVQNNVPRDTIGDTLKEIDKTYLECRNQMAMILQNNIVSEEAKADLLKVLDEKFGQGVSPQQHMTRLEKVCRVKSRYHIKRDVPGANAFDVLRTWGPIPLKKGWEHHTKILAEFHQMFIRDFLALMRYHHSKTQPKIDYVNLSIDGVDGGESTTRNVTIFCMQVPQLNCTYWFPVAIYVRNCNLTTYYLTKNRCLGYLIDDVHDEHIMLHVCVMDTIERYEIRGLVGTNG